MAGYACPVTGDRGLPNERKAFKSGGFCHHCELERLRLSLAEQSRNAMEIIVVDNASSDGSPNCVQKRYPQVRLIRNNSNLGFAKANNIGIRQSSGRYLCLVNSDAKVFKGCIDVLVDYCEQHPEVGMAGPRVVGADGKLQRSCRGFPTLWNTFCRALALDAVFPKVKLFTMYSLSHWPQENLSEVDILSGCFWVIRRQALDKVGLLDETFFMYGEDMDWCKRFQSAGWKNVFVPSAHAVHYGGASSANAPVRFYVEKQRADFQYWKKHHSRFAVACYLLISCLHSMARVIGYSAAALFAKQKRAACRHKVERSIACLRLLISRRSPSQTNPAKSPG